MLRGLADLYKEAQYRPATLPRCISKALAGCDTVGEAHTPVADAQAQLIARALQAGDVALAGSDMMLYRPEDTLGDLAIEPLEVSAGCRREGCLDDHTPNSR